MGIELPAELRDVAARAGARWPEADEDAMRESATAWRDAAKAIEGLAASADGAAQGALRAFDGEAAEAASREWDGFVSDDGVLPSSVQQCQAAADRLEHAAEQIGAAKVQLVRELVSLAKQTDAAEQAAAAGHPQALAVLDSAVQGAAANVAQLHNTLAAAVDPDSGVRVDQALSGLGDVALNAGAGLASTVDSAAGGLAEAAGGAVAGVGETAGGAVAGVGQVAGDAVAGVSESAGGAVEGVGRVAGGTVGGVAEVAGGAVGDVGRATGEVVGGAAEHVGGAVDEVGRVGRDAVGGVAEDVGSAAEQVGRGTVGGGAAGAQDEISAVAQSATGWQADAEHTGPVKVDPAAWAPGLADAGTGPIPVSTGKGWTPGDDPASTTAPHAVQSAWAAPQAPPPPLPPGAAAPQPGFAPPPAPGGGGHFVAPPGASPAAPPPSAVPPSAVPPSARPPVAPGAFGAPQPPQQQQQQPRNPVQRSPLRPLPAPPQPPAPPAVEPVQRPLRQGGRNADVVAFVLHQFPIGYMPVAASQASRQLPPPSEGPARPGLNFPPHDHPESHLVDDRDALDRLRSGEVYAAAQRDREERDEPQQVPEELLANHDPLGEFSELEWEREFLVRDGERSEYAWPPADEHPEGAVEPAEPVVLEPDTVLDCTGSGAGRFSFALATAFGQRSLPEPHAEREYRRYRVMRRLPVWQSVTAPWFAQPGGGVRYRTTHSLDELVALGYLVELTRSREAAEAVTLRIERETAEGAEVVESTFHITSVATERIARERSTVPMGQSEKEAGK
ncbi:glycohydrolase toxin TNT-related protein [Saccharopolyspora sp. NPDC000359]|uniref:glycohydrolase toxin TNT-related protein n=1 Tax=Saccharopolyspora sp. NPDC000359 TaxID=3154251 RepID=UPI0033333E36